MIAPRWAAVRDSVATLHPGYFALVMATAIVSVGVRNHHLYGLSAALLWLAGACYALLLVLNGWRLIGYRDQVRTDLASPTRSFGAFTFVAGSDVLGARLALDGHTAAAAVLLVIGALAWLVLGFLVPWIAVLRPPRRRPVVAAAAGTWFIAVVASQSVALLAATLQPVVGAGGRGLAVLAVVAWSIGIVCYPLVAILVAAWLLRHEVRPADLTPPYWVAMGATAISVLAGTRIMRLAGAADLTALRELAGGVSLVFWAFGTALIPVLVAATWWRHVTHRVPLRYEATWWSVVFPLGMYGVATHDLGRTSQLPLIAAIGGYETWLALGVWAAVFAAMLTHLRRALRPRPPLRRSGMLAPGRGAGPFGLVEDHLA